MLLGDELKERIKKVDEAYAKSEKELEDEQKKKIRTNIRSSI